MDTADHPPRARLHPARPRHLCGTLVVGPAGGPRFASPENYISKHLAEKILTSKTALEGERKQVTVLFAERILKQPAAVVNKPVVARITATIQKIGRIKTK